MAITQRPHVTVEEVRRIFEYLPETGQLRRRITTSANAKAGDIAGALDGKGYLQVSVAKRFYRFHRIVFLHVHGWLPEQLDHIDGDKLNNRVENLRPCTCSGNAGNAKIMSHNTSGYRGVYFYKRDSRWVAQIKVFGETTYLGRFDSAEAAAVAYNTAAKEHFGEFARLNNV